MIEEKAAVCSTEIEKKLPESVTNVIPRATMPVIEAARTTIKMLSTVRNCGVVRPPASRIRHTASPTLAGATSLRQSRLARGGGPSSEAASAAPMTSGLTSPPGPTGGSRL